MRTKLITLTVAFSLLAGLVPSMATSTHATDLPRAGHHCCQKMASVGLPSLLAPLPPAPHGPSHSCHTLRLPAKLPSASSTISRDGQIYHITARNSGVTHRNTTKLALPNVVLPSPLELSAVLRV